MKIRDVNKIFFLAFFAQLFVFYRCRPWQFIKWSALMPLATLVALAVSVCGGPEHRHNFGMACAAKALENPTLPAWAKSRIEKWSLPYTEATP